MTSLVVPVDFPSEIATQLAIANNCAGFYSGIPPKWAVLSNTQGWTLPCVVIEDEAGNVLSWFPVVG